MAKKLRISQCMIVKNEEKNIRKALSWGKGIVWEQIVVDTGSTDATVEIAESMGAKVFHFKWIDDFSAAKNYAIEQAKGDWIAFLDADEYFTPDDAKKLLILLKSMEDKYTKKTMPTIVRSAWLQLNDEGKVFAISQQDRIFLNRKDIRYENPIHEGLHSTEGKDLTFLSATDYLSIMHTGYQGGVIKDKGKRNTPLLRKLVEEQPENYNAWSYLADSLYAEDLNDEAMEVAEKVINEGLDKTDGNRLDVTFALWFNVAAGVEDSRARSLRGKAYEYYDRFCQTGLVQPDVEFAMALYQHNTGNKDEAARFFELALSKIEKYHSASILKITAKLDFVYTYLTHYYFNKNNAQKTVYYATLSLRTDRYQKEALVPLLQLLKKDPATRAPQAFAFLGKLYQFDKLKDKLFVLQASLSAEYGELTELLRGSMTEEELKWLDKRADEAWILERGELEALYPQIQIRNRTDQNFLYLAGELLHRSREGLRHNAVSPEMADFLRERREDILWIYGELGDYRSRQLFYGLMEFWMHREYRILNVSRENNVPYWDLDLIPTADGMKCVCVGEHLLESVNGFLYAYGDTYQAIYCYEDTADISVAENAKLEWGDPEKSDIKKALADYHDVSCYKAPMTRLCLDDAIQGAVDIIQIETGYPLLSLLENSARHIREDQPGIAVSLNAKPEQLCKVTRLLKELNPNYRLYLRYCGTELDNRTILFAI